MLDEGGIIKCRIYCTGPGFFQIYILAEKLGIWPGDKIISNYEILEGHNTENSSWYIRLYTPPVFKKNIHKRKYRSCSRIPKELYINSIYYHNEIIRISESEIEKRKESWFEQDIKASILLPIIKNKSKIPNDLIYVDEYWKI